MIDFILVFLGIICCVFALACLGGQGGEEEGCIGLIALAIGAAMLACAYAF